MTVEVLRSTGNVLVMISATLAVLTVIVYGRVPWYRSMTGRQLMALYVSIALILLLATISFWFRADPWFTALRILVFTSFPVVQAWQLYLHVRAQIREHGESYPDQD